MSDEKNETPEEWTKRFFKKELQQMNMSDEKIKCGLCGVTENVFSVWNSWSCEYCYKFFEEATQGKEHLPKIIYKLIMRIERLEEKLNER